MSLIDITLGLGLPAPARRLGDVRPLAPARKGRAALLSRAARASGYGRVVQRGCRIVTNCTASLEKAIGEEGMGSMESGDRELPCGK